MKRSFILLFVLIIVSFVYFFAALMDSISISDINIQVDPYKKNPLTAIVSFKTNKPAQVSITIKGKNGTDDLTNLFPEYKNNHEIPVLGLYPNYKNTVIIKAYFQNKKSKTEEISIQTNVPYERALFTIQEKNDNKTRYHYLSEGLVFDEEGNLRFSFNSQGNLIYYLKGELVSENRIGGLIRYSLMGEEKQRYPYPKGFTSFTHGIGQKPNGNFLVIGSLANSTITVDGKEVPSHRDFVIELDYKTGKMLNKIDLAELLNPHRAVVVHKNYIEYGLNDWCHVNGVDYDSTDSSIVVSCRHSGIIKIDEKTNELVWIIAPNKDFNKSGRTGKGPDISHKVLTAVDKNGNVFKREIQQGIMADKNFKWPLQNHNVKIYPNHIITIYDNSGNIYDKSVYTTNYSNAIIYKIDEEKRTVQQVWKKDLNFRSDAGSSVLYHPEEKEVIVYSSAIADKNRPGYSYGQLTRYDLDTQKILFSAIIYRGGDSYFYRNEDFEFYPKEKE